jgi:hypothetical protein
MVSPIPFCSYARIHRRLPAAGGLGSRPLGPPESGPTALITAPLTHTCTEARPHGRAFCVVSHSGLGSQNGRRPGGLQGLYGYLHGLFTPWHHSCRAEANYTTHARYGILMSSTTCKQFFASCKGRPANRQAQAWRALDAIALGLHALDAGLLYGFTQEELAAYRPAWEQHQGSRP